jgi:hypothetical protein
MRKGDKVVCADSYMLDVHDSDSRVELYAMLEAGMEGILVEFWGTETVILEFYGTKVLANLDDFEDGTFFIPTPPLRLIE